LQGGRRRISQRRRRRISQGEQFRGERGRRRRTSQGVQFRGERGRISRRRMLVRGHNGWNKRGGFLRGGGSRTADHVPIGPVHRDFVACQLAEKGVEGREGLRTTFRLS
jgi:hypothetical protein